MTARDPLAEAAARYHAATVEQEAARQALAEQVIQALRDDRDTDEITAITGYTARHIRNLRGDKLPPRRPGRKPQPKAAVEPPTP